jgi:GNAT superfamily N-acetyltransferase
MLEVRSVRDQADEDASLAVYNRVWPRDAVTMAEVRSYSARATDYGDHVALVNLEPVGSASIALMPTRPTLGFVLLTVLTEHRRRGVGSALYMAASAWCEDRGVHELEGMVPEDDAESLAWAERRGFRPVERNSRLVLDLTAIEPPDVAAPTGIAIVTLAHRPALKRGIYDVACEAYPDIPGWRGVTMEPFESWVAHRLERTDDRADATFIAVADEEVVGYAKFMFTAARPRDAEHDMTAVKRAWRGRGIAGALKRAQVAWAKREGFERLQTQNEVRNEPIRRINEQLGYRVEPGRVIVRGPTADAQGRTRARR